MEKHSDKQFKLDAIQSIRKREYLFKQKTVEYDVKLDLGVNY